MTQVLYFTLPKRTFAPFCKEAMGAQALQHQTEMSLVHIRVRTVYQDIIQVHSNAHIQEILEHNVHQPLEG